jgi:hypothetical protein
VGLLADALFPRVALGWDYVFPEHQDNEVAWRVMKDDERVQRWVILLNHYGDEWVHNYPVDAEVNTQTEVVWFGNVKLARGPEGKWAVSS